MGLEEVLTEEQKARILNEVERERRLAMIVEMASEEWSEDVASNLILTQQFITKNPFRDVSIGATEAYLCWNAIRSLSSLCSIEREIATDLVGADNIIWLKELQSIPSSSSVLSISQQDIIEVW